MHLTMHKSSDDDESSVGTLALVLMHLYLCATTYNRIM